MADPRYFSNGSTHTYRPEDRYAQRTSNPAYTGNNSQGRGDGGFDERQKRNEPDAVKLKRCPSFLLGKPLQDYDASIEHDIKVPSTDTFVIISRRGKTSTDQVHRFTMSRSLCLMGPLNPVRLCATRILIHQYFEVFVIFIILVNCIFLALDHPPEEAEYVFAFIYTLEMFLKIIAKGFVMHSFAYLRDGWNALDFFVVIMGYVTLAPNIANFSGIRTIRVLRALRTISAMKGLKAMVNTLLRSMKMLSDVLVLFLFFLCVMALIGLQLFVGELRNKCIKTPQGSLNMSYREYASIEDNWYVSDGEPIICGNASSAIPCPENYTCLPDAGPNPNYGYTSFDNIGWSLVMAFQLLTLDFWENLYNKIMGSVGAWYVFYFVGAIFFCSFYLLNLVLAVVALSYEQEIRAAVHEKERQKKEKRTAVSYPADEDTLLRLRPIDNSLDVQIRTIKAIRIEKESIIEAKKKKPQHKESILRRIASKGTFKDVLDSKLKDVRFRRDTRFWARFQRILLKGIDHPAFEIAVMSFILANTVVLALYHHGIDPKFKKVLDVLNLFLTAVFTIEMTVKLMALGFMDYLQSRWNIFDGIIVIVSLIDTVFELADVRESAGTSIFRTFRLVRILKLAQSWKTMGKLLATIANSVGPIGNITLILILIIYIFAVMGVKVFGKAYTEEIFPEGIPRWNFNDFWHSFMMVFRILCGEWIEPLWDCMKATNPAAIVFFIPAFVIGNFIVLNLFLALLLNAFDNEEDDDEEDDDEEDGGEPFLTLIKRKLSSARRWAVPLRSTPKESTANGIANHELSDNELSVKSTNIILQPRRLSLVSDGSNTTESAFGPSPPKKRPEGEVQITECLPEFLMAPLDCIPWTCMWWIRFRGRVRYIVEHRFFEWFILSLVFVSSFVLVFEDVHLKEQPKLAYGLDMLNYVFAAIFAMEFVLKITGLGIVEYFSSFWNFLDSFIVAISMACVVQDKNLSVFRSLRTVRALRPLRAVSRLEGMKVVVNALFAAIPGIANVLLVSLLFWLIFSILGVQLFAGMFFKCIDGDGNRIPASEINNKSMCLARANDSYYWANSKVNFDNVIYGFLALFQVATFEGWMEIMDDAVDARGIDLQPSDEFNFSSYVFFVIFIIIGSFFVLNLFVGVIIDNFNTLKRKYDELSGMGMLLTERQRKWVDMLKEAAKKRAPAQAIRPSDYIRGTLFDVVTGTTFEILLLGVIMANMTVMMIQHYDMSPNFTVVLTNFNRVFTGVFILETTSKLIALRVYYFRKAWNIFDFIIVILSIVGLFMDEFNTGYGNPSLLRVMRIFRVARLLRLLEFAKGIRQLLVALIISLPALLNIGTLLFLVIFIYAIIGMSTFGHVKKHGNIDDSVNFQTFGNSMMVLFRLSTGAGWNDILDSLMVEPPDCEPHFEGLPNGNCGFPLGAPLYLVSYILFVFLIIVNMYIAVILENVNRAQESGNFIFKKEDFDAYFQKWNDHVKGGKQYIPIHKLSALVADLNEKFRIPQPNHHELVRLDIPVRIGARIHCFDILRALVKRRLEKQGESPEAFEQIACRLETQFKRSFTAKKVSSQRSTPNGSIRHHENGTRTTFQKATKFIVRKKRQGKLDEAMFNRMVQRREALGLHHMDSTEDSAEEMEEEVFEEEYCSDESDEDRESLSYYLFHKNKAIKNGTNFLSTSMFGSFGLGKLTTSTYTIDTSQWWIGGSRSDNGSDRTES